MNILLFLNKRFLVFYEIPHVPAFKMRILKTRVDTVFLKDYRTGFKDRTFLLIVSTDFEVCIYTLDIE